jgi:hypothetical protein
MKMASSDIYNHEAVAPKRFAKLNAKGKIPRRAMNKKTKEEASGARIANEETAVSMVTVACKLPAGFILEADWELREIAEPGPAGVRMVKQWHRKANGRRFLIRGNRVPLGMNGVEIAPKDCDISCTGGYAFTRIPKDAWEKWWERIGHDWQPCQGQSPMVFALDAKSAKAKAREHEQEFDYLKPIKPVELDVTGNPIGFVDPRLNQFRQVATNDELAVKMGLSEPNPKTIHVGKSGSAAEQEVAPPKSLSTTTGMAKG